MANLYPTNGIIPQYNGGNLTLGSNFTTTSASYVNTGLTFTLPSAGTWYLTYGLSGANATAGQQAFYQLFDSTNSVSITGSQTQVASGTATQITGSTYYTTTGPVTLQIQTRTGGSGTAYVFNSGGGPISYFYDQIAGLVPVTGQTVDNVEYTNVTSTVILAAAAPMTFDTLIGGNIPYSAGSFTLTAGKTYELRGIIAYQGGVGATYGAYQWYNVTGAVSIGSLGQSILDTGTSTFSSTGDSVAIITPSTNITVQLRAVNAFTAGNAGRSYASIKQLGTSATTTTTLAQVKAIMPAQSITNNSFVTVTGTYTVIQDSASNFSASTGVFTAPRTAAYYAQAGVTFSTAVNGFPQTVSIIRNNSTTDTQNISAGTSTANADASHPNVSGMFYLTAGDTLRVTAFQNTAGAQTLVVTPSGSTQSVSNFSVVELPSAK